MIPIPVPDEAKLARPDCRLVDMGRPRGVPESECGSAEMLIGGRALTGFAGRAQYAYFRPSPEEIAQLQAGGFLEMCQIGTVVQPFSLAVWPTQEPPNEGAATDDVTEQGDAGRDSTATGPRDGADSQDVGHVTSEAAPDGEKGGVGESSADPATPRFRGVTSDPTDPGLGRGVDREAKGMNEVYLVLSEDERARGFVRPVRRTYVHETCGAATTMGQALAETYARQPSFYGATFCVRCQMHKPVGEHGEFVWDDGTKVGT